MADVQLNPNQQLLVDLGIRDIEEFTSTQEDNQSQEPSESSEEQPQNESITDILADPKFNLEGNTQNFSESVQSNIQTGEPPINMDLDQQTQEALNQKNSALNAGNLPTYDTLYDPPEDQSYVPGLGGPSVFTRGSALIADFADIYEGGDDVLTASQMEMEKYEQEKADFEVVGQKVYESTGYPATADFSSASVNVGDPIRLYDIIDDDGEIVKSVIVPKPGSTPWARVFSQSMDDIVRQTGDLIGGNIRIEGEFSKSIPTMPLDTWEDLSKDVLTFGVMGTSMGNITKTITTNAIKKMASPKTVKKIGYLSSLGGAAIADTIYVPEEDKPLLVTTKYIQNTFGIKDAKKAANAAMFFDSLFLGGAFDSVLKPLGMLAKGTGKKVKSVVDVVAGNKEKLKGIGKQTAALDILRVLDPELETGSAFDFKNRLVAFTSLLNENNITKLDLGSMSKEIELDTTNTVVKNAEVYVKRTRQNLKGSMSDAEWDAYVQKEGADLATRMIQIAKGNDPLGAIANGQQRIIAQIDATFGEAADAQLGAGRSANETLGDTAENLINQRNIEFKEAENVQSTAKEQLENVKVLEGQVVKDNPQVQALVNEIDAFDELFNDTAAMDKLRKLLGDDVFNIYKNDYEAFQRAYKNIDPEGTPLPGESILKLERQLLELSKESDAFDPSGGRAKRILSKVSNALTRKVETEDPTSELFDAPLTQKETNALETAKLTVKDLKDKAKTKELSRTDQTNLNKAELKIKQLENKKVEVELPGAETTETNEEFIKRLVTEGNLTVKSLITLKQTLSQEIDDLSPDQAAIRNRLRSLRDSITDADNEVVDEITGETLKDAGHLNILKNYADDDPELVERITEADRLFKVFKSKFGNSEPMKQFSENAETLMKKGKTYSSIEDAPLRGEVEFKAKNAQIVDTVIADKSMAYTDELDYILKSDEFSSTVKEAVVGKTIRKIAESLRAGDTESVNVLLGAVNTNRELLERQAPELFNALNNIVKEIELSKSGLAQERQVAEDALKIADDAVAKFDNDFLARTLVSQEADDFGNMAARSNPQAVIKEMFSGNDAVGNVKALRREIAKLNEPEQIIAEEALKNTAIRNLQETLFGSTPTGLAQAGSTPIATLNTQLGRISKSINEGTNSDLAVIREVFKDDPLVSEGIIGALNELKTANIPGRLKTKQVGSDTSDNLAVRDTVSTGILLVFGYMNRMSATARRLSAGQLEKAENVAQSIKDESVAIILTNPREFATALETIQKTTSEKLREDAIAIFVQGAKTDVRTTEETQNFVSDNLEQAMP